MTSNKDVRLNFLPVNILTLTFMVRQAQLAQAKGYQVRLLVLNKVSKLLCKFLKLDVIDLCEIGVSSVDCYASSITSDFFNPGSYLYSKKKNYPMFSYMERVLIRNIAGAISLGGVDERFIIWNGQTAPCNLVARYVESKNLAVAYLENGYFPNTTQVDHLGVNKFSSIRAFFNERSLKHPLAENVSREHVCSNGLKVFMLSRLVDGPLIFLLRVLLIIEMSFSGRRNSMNEVEGFFVHLKNFIVHVLSRKIVGCFSSLCRKSLSGVASDVSINALFPLQVHDDTQVMAGGSWLSSSPENYFISTLNFLDNEKIKMDFIVRNHPKDISRYKYKVFGGYACLRVEFDDKTQLHQLIDRADVVVTYNSTVGFEALLRNKPVVLIGDNFYSALPNCYSLMDFARRIKQVGSVSGLLSYRYTKSDAAYLKRFFVDANWRETTLAAQGEIFDAIEKVLTSRFSCPLESSNAT